MNHLEERLRIEGVNETSIKEILQYVKDTLVEEYQEGYEEGFNDGHSNGYEQGYHLGKQNYKPW